MVTLWGNYEGISQCKAAQAGRGYEITAWGGWQDKREMRLAVYPLSSEKTLLSRLFFAL
ncbi:hypothetical protein GR697_18935 [Klebsiella pneumoniae]|nr:hypothetical protein [Klebsiella pneumoniae]MXL41020.1 hypothetical protein [Klebsiella pneumoniae]